MKKTIKLVQNKFPKKLIVRSSSKSRNFLHESEEEITNHSDSELADNYFRQFLDWVKNNRRNYPRIFQLFEKDIKDWNSINSGEEWTQLVIDAADMLFATNMSSNIQNLNEGYMGFDLIIQEESGKCYPTELIYPLIAGTKWVLIGDQAQLPPFEYRTIREKVFENLASFDIEKKKQLFPSEKIFDEFTEETDNMIKLFNYIFDKCNEQKEVKYKANTILNNQYRLPPKISDLISSIFYKQIGNFIIETESPPSDWILNPVKFQNHELIWLNTENNPANFEKKGSRYYNLHEVNVIKKLIDNLSFNSKYKKPEISIITPYNQQKEHLEAQLPKKLPSDSEIDIRNSIYSVDSFQGRESDLIIISLVRNNSNTKSLNSIFGFISEKERLNVMLSRSMCAMIVVGNIDLWKEMRGLDSAERLFEVAEFFEKNGLVIKSNDFIEGGKNGRK